MDFFLFHRLSIVTDLSLSPHNLHDNQCKAHSNASIDIHILDLSLQLLGWYLYSTSIILNYFHPRYEFFYFPEVLHWFFQIWTIITPQLLLSKILFYGLEQEMYLLDHISSSIRRENAFRFEFDQFYLLPNQLSSLLLLNTAFPNVQAISEYRKLKWQIPQEISPHYDKRGDQRYNCYAWVSWKQKCMGIKILGWIYHILFLGLSKFHRWIYSLPKHLRLAFNPPIT